jgi:Fe-S-cluster containining protein
MEIWRQQGKTEILRAMEHAKPVWAGDVIVCSENGKMLFTCPFLRYEGRYYTCTIYEDRPITCRDYIPGSSALCSQYKNPI